MISLLRLVARWQELFLLVCFAPAILFSGEAAASGNPQACRALSEFIGYAAGARDSGLTLGQLQAVISQAPELAGPQLALYLDLAEAVWAKPWRKPEVEAANFHAWCMREET